MSDEHRKQDEDTDRDVCARIQDAMEGSSATAAAKSAPSTTDKITGADVVALAGEAGGKFQQVAAEYLSNADNVSVACASCTFYQAGNTDAVAGSCAVVDGAINWHGTCRYYIPGDVDVAYWQGFADGSGTVVAEKLKAQPSESVLTAPQLEALGIEVEKALPVLWSTPGGSAKFGRKIAAVLPSDAGQVIHLWPGNLGVVLAMGRSKSELLVTDDKASAGPLSILAGLSQTQLEKLHAMEWGTDDDSRAAVEAEEPTTGLEKLYRWLYDLQIKANRSGPPPKLKQYRDRLHRSKILLRDDPGEWLAAEDIDESALVVAMPPNKAALDAHSLQRALLERTGPTLVVWRGAKWFEDGWESARTVLVRRFNGPRMRLRVLANFPLPSMKSGDDEVWDDGPEPFCTPSIVIPEPRIKALPGRTFDTPDGLAKWARPFLAGGVVVDTGGELIEYVDAVKLLDDLRGWNAGRLMLYSKAATLQPGRTAALLAELLPPQDRPWAMLKSVEQSPIFVRKEYARVTKGAIYHGNLADAHDEHVVYMDLEGACWDFTSRFRQLSVMHDGVIIGEADVVESYISEVGYRVKAVTGGVVEIRPGDWLGAARWPIEVFERVLSGEFNSFSFEGSAAAVPAGSQP